MKKISSWISAHIAMLVLLVCVIALYLPQSFTWMPTSIINPMLGVVMFGMGLTLKLSDFKVVFTHPKEICVGVLAQFTVMPLLALFLTHLFQLPLEIAIGVILVGCCPGGTASNVITYLGKGDVALSIGMTAVSTLLAPFLTPFLIYLLAGESLQVDVLAMFISIFQVVIIPILMGFFINRYFRNFTIRMVAFLPMLSTITISAIIGCIISHHADKIAACNLLLWTVVIFHNLLGLLLGYAISKAFHLQKAKRTAITIEVGMQNSGLATSLAATHFAAYPLAAIPGAIFSVWHNIAGSVVASLLKR